MTTIEYIFDGEKYYILSPRWAEMSLFAGQVITMKAKKKLNTNKIFLASKQLFDNLREKHGSVMLDL
jgi:hypothetical protein